LTGFSGRSKFSSATSGASEKRMPNLPKGVEATSSFSRSGRSSLFAFGGFTNESLSLNLTQTFGTKWQIYGMGTLNLRGGSQYHSLFITHQWRPRWRILLEMTWQGYRGFSYTDYTIRLMHDLGNGVSLSLNWSKSRRRFYVELGALQF